MARRTRKTREERRAARLALIERAERGDLVLPEAIRDIRLALDMTQTEFAEAFRLTRRQVSELENGRANATAETMTRIARPFGLTLGFVPRPK